VRPRVTSGSAATALALLECDPDKLVLGPLGGRNRQSAAARARECYKEALGRQAPADLLEFDSPAAASSAAVPDLAVAMPAVVAAAAAAAAPATASSAVPSENADVAAGLWPGDAVLARYGPRDCFYRARIVRIYSRNGESLADVEWLRPQAGTPEDGLYLPTGTNLDSNLHRHGLKVATDLRYANGGGSVDADGVAALPRATVAPLPPPPGQTRGVALAAGAGELHDLLDLQGAAGEAADLLGGSPVLAAEAMAPAAAAFSADLMGGAPAAGHMGMASLPVDAHMASRPPMQHSNMPLANGTWGAQGAWGTAQPGLASAGAVGSPPVVLPAPDSASRGPGMMPLPATGGSAPSVAAPWLPVESPQPLVTSPERFGFVSDMISKAADAPAGVEP